MAGGGDGDNAREKFEWKNMDRKSKKKEGGSLEIMTAEFKARVGVDCIGRARGRGRKTRAAKREIVFRE